jgi:hypothetical protein
MKDESAPRCSPASRRYPVLFRLMKLSLLLLLFFAARLLADAAWPSVPFASVRGYAWPDNPETVEVILSGMKLAPGVINREGALLTPDQVRRLCLAAVHEPPTITGLQKITIVNCYKPHNAFVFYNTAEKPVAYIEICFSCLGNKAQPPIPSHFPDYFSLATIFEELRLPMGPYTTAKAFGNARLDP